MPIDIEVPIAQSVANGLTTVFPHAFTLFAADDLVVKVDTAGVITYPVFGSDYTVTGLGSNSGSVVFSVAPVATAVVTRYRDTKLKRTTDYQENGDLLANTLDSDIDRLWMALQERVAGGTIAPTSMRVPVGETISELPKASDRALRVLAFDSLGAPLLIAGVDSGSAAALALDVASAASATKGAGQVGYNAALSYLAGSVGYALKAAAAISWSSLPGKPTTKSTLGVTDVVAYADLVTHRNRLINGNFSIKQDATYASGAAVPSGGYIHDQWKAGSGGGTATWATSGLDTTLTITAGTFLQIIESVFVEGGTYTLSWSGTAQARIDGGAYAASPITVTGKTAATNITVEFGTGTVSKAQFEPGSTVTPFERRDDELRRCQRYYWVLGHNIALAGYASASGGVYYNNCSFPVAMRAAPTMSSTFASPANIAVQSVSAVGVDGFNLFIQSAAAGVTSSVYSSGNTANARL